MGADIVETALIPVVLCACCRLAGPALSCQPLVMIDDRMRKIMTII